MIAKLKPLQLSTAQLEIIESPAVFELKSH